MGIEPFIGQVQPYAGNYPPRNWAWCWGQTLAIQQYTALYSLIGTQYGGNGTTNFNLPDLRSRAAVGIGQGPGLTNRVAGQAGGALAVPLVSNELPPHTHFPASNGTPSLAVQAEQGRGTASTPTNGCILAASYNIPFDAEIAWYVASSPNLVPLGGVTCQVQPQVAVGAAGESQPHPNVQPVQGINYIIALQGIYPSRP